MRRKKDDLVKLAQDGNEAAFEKLVRLHTPAVHAAIQTELKIHADVRDAAQETFMSAYHGLAGYDGRVEFAKWLKVIAFRCARRLRHDRERHAHAPLEDDFESPDADPERRAISSDNGSHILDAIQQLPDMERKVYSAHLQGMSGREISSMLGVDESAARNSIYRAVAKLRVALEPLV